MANYRYTEKVAENIFNELKISLDDLISIDISDVIEYDNKKFSSHIDLFDYELKKYYNTGNLKYSIWFKLINKSMDIYEGLK
tara:strand:- start:1790 stop:2035 length:246 start_codon:yes stop_codon:yes gene_type:complete